MVTPNFQGEVQLAGWSESHSGGCKVVLWLSDASDLDAFRAMTVRKGNQAGQRMMAVFVEIGDDEQPVPTQPAEPQEDRKGGPLARLAGIWCADPAFRAWLREKEDATGPIDEDEAAAIIRIDCGIDSRAELDHSARARTLFDQHFRIPYSRYLQGE